MRINSADCMSASTTETNSEFKDPLITQDLGATYIERGLVYGTDVWELPTVKEEPKLEPQVDAKIKIEDQDNADLFLTVQRSEDLPSVCQSRGHQVQDQEAQAHTRDANRYSNDTPAQLSDTLNMLSCTSSAAMDDKGRFPAPARNLAQTGQVSVQWKPSPPGTVNVLRKILLQLHNQVVC